MNDATVTRNAAVAAHARATRPRRSRDGDDTTRHDKRASHTQDASLGVSPMTPEQANELGKRIINTMRPTPALIEWTEVLEPLDFDQALLTFRDLRERTDDGLRIARFLAAYRRRTDPDLAAPARHAARPTTEDCPHCRGCGFEAGPPEYETVLGQPHEYSTLVPCRCTRPAARPARPAAPTLDL